MGSDRCAGCLGSERCWVCLGAGTIEPRPGDVSVCVRCAGSGRCFVCQDVPVPIPIARQRRTWHRLVPAQRSVTPESESEAAS